MGNIHSFWSSIHFLYSFYLSFFICFLFLSKRLLVSLFLFYFIIDIYERNFKVTNQSKYEQIVFFFFFTFFSASKYFSKVPLFSKSSFSFYLVLSCFVPFIFLLFSLSIKMRIG